MYIQVKKVNWVYLKINEIVDWKNSWKVLLYHFVYIAKSCRKVNCKNVVRPTSANVSLKKWVFCRHLVPELVRQRITCKTRQAKIMKYSMAWLFFCRIHNYPCSTYEFMNIPDYSFCYKPNGRSQDIFIFDGLWTIWIAKWSAIKVL